MTSLLRRLCQIPLHAATEVLQSVPAILAMVAQSHSAIGHDDPHVFDTLTSLFRPKEGQSVRECVHEILTSPSGAGGGGDPSKTASELVRLIIRLMIEFEKDDASVGMRGSPLVNAAVALIRRLAVLRGYQLPTPATLPPDLRQPLSPSGAAADAADALPTSAYNAPTDGATAAAAAAGEGLDEENAVRVSSAASEERAILGADGLPLRSFEVDSRSTVSGSGVGGSGGGGRLSTRSIQGILHLLALPSEGVGRIDGTTGQGDVLSYLFGRPLKATEKLEALRECARRVFYLLTMTSDSGVLTVPEAERRVLFFIQSLYMRQMPVSKDILAMPAFNVLTPVYAGE